jgi:chorismate synthase
LCGDSGEPIAEAFLALVLIDHAMRQRAQNGDAVDSIGIAERPEMKGTGSARATLEDPDPLEA